MHLEVITRNASGGYKLKCTWRLQLDMHLEATIRVHLETTTSMHLETTTRNASRG